MLSRRCIEKVGLFNPIFHHYGEDLDFAQRANYFCFLIGIVPSAYAIHDRPQSPVISLDKQVLINRAVLMYRLSRLNLSICHNLFSVFYGSLISSCPKEISFIKKLDISITNIAYLIFNLHVALKNRKITQKGGFCFFKAADAHMQKYLT